MKKQTLVVQYAVLIVMAVLMVFPLLFTAALSLSDNTDIVNGIYLPQTLHFENYAEAYQEAELLYYMKNSVIISTLTTFFQVLFALLAAYAIVFIPFKGKGFVFALFMSGMMIPMDILMITNFQTIRALDLLNTYPGIILPCLGSAFGIFLLRQNMKQIPMELKEAADISGVGTLYFFRKVALPLSKNSIITLAVYCFLVSWNNYLWPLIATTKDRVRTIQIGLRMLTASDTQKDFRLVAAATMIVTIPTLILMFLGQNRLQEGLTKGALK